MILEDDSKIVNPSRNDVEIKIMRLSKEIFSSLDICDSLRDETKNKLIEAIEAVVTDVSKCRH